jgi:spore coat protein U-like protein
MSATAAVVGSCSFTASAMEFGTLNRANAGTTTATSTITPNCTSGLSYTVTSAASATTLLLDGTSALETGQIAFPLKRTDNNATLVSGANGITGIGTGSATANAVTITGTAASAETKLSGAYSASVTLTITY